MTPARIKRLTLTATILGSAIATLDSTIVSVALPTIQRSLGGGLAGQQWISSAYLLTLGSLILIGGSLGDIFGERRIFALGVAGFGITSLLCAVAPTLGLLVGARALQGVAGALLTPSSLAVIAATFSDEQRGAAIGTWTAFGAIATVIGPLVGGELLALASWRWLFVINLPVAACCLTLILWVIPRPARSSGPRRRVDLAGAGLCSAGLAGVVFAMIEAPRLGWSDPAILASLLGGVALFAGFLARERATRDPMLPLGIFRRANFSAANIETFTVYAALSVFFFFLVLYLQQVAGWSPLHSGLATLPATVVMFALSRYVGRLSARHGPRLFMSTGPLLAAAGLLLALRIGRHPGYFSDLLPAVVVFALGLSLTVTPLTTTVLAGVEADAAGIASAVNNAVARIAGLLATAGVGAIVAAHFTTTLHARLGAVALGGKARSVLAATEHLVLGRPSVGGLPRAQGAAILRAASSASLSSFHLGVVIAAALLAIGAGVGLAGIRNPPPRS
ncbi:MAG: MFS transporter [Solirubrobacteraceae bacterium]|jgi:EmrB/QacA subfamily drug resistance transporter